MIARRHSSRRPERRDMFGLSIPGAARYSAVLTHPDLRNH